MVSETGGRNAAETAEEGAATAAVAPATERAAAAQQVDPVVQQGQMVHHSSGCQQ